MPGVASVPSPTFTSVFTSSFMVALSVLAGALLGVTVAVVSAGLVLSEQAAKVKLAVKMIAHVK